MSLDDAISMREAAFGGRSRMGVVGAMRRRLEWLLPVALFVLLVQMAAPIGASRLAAAVLANPLSATEICHSDPDAAPADQSGDQHGCNLDCLICCVLHAGLALDAPRLPVLVAPQRQTSVVVWHGEAIDLIHARAGSNAQARAPPIFS
jgi:hypothetical protein